MGERGRRREGAEDESKRAHHKSTDNRAKGAHKHTPSPDGHHLSAHTHTIHISIHIQAYIPMHTDIHIQRRTAIHMPAEARDESKTSANHKVRRARAQRAVVLAEETHT